MPPGRSRALAVLATLAVALVLTAPGVLGASDLYVGDVGHFEQPRDELVTQRLLAGQGLPRWLPGVWGGSPALGGQELALLYPPNDLLLVACPSRARVLGLALHLVLAVLGARALARRLGARDAPALLAGLVYGFGGAAVALNAVPVYVRSAAWLPWAVLGLLRASQGSSGRLASERLPSERLPGLALAVLALLGTYLGGDPLGCAFAGLVGALVSLAALDLPLARRARNVLLATLAAGALTALLGAAQLLPATLATRESVRAAGMTYEGATQFSLEPAELLGLLVPFAFGAQAEPRTAFFEALFRERGWPGSEVIYVGPVALALALLGLASLAFSRTSRGSDHENVPRIPILGWRLRAGSSAPASSRLARAGLLVALVFVVLALGRHTPVYRAFFALPLAALFRYPAKLLLQASLGLALLGAAGAQALLDDATADDPTLRDDGSRKLRGRLAALLGTLGALALVASNVARLGPLAEWLDGLGSSELSGREAANALAARLAHVAFVALGASLLALSSHERVAAWLRARRLRPVSSARLPLALALLVAVDLGLACRAAPIWGPRDEVARPPAVARVLAELARKDGVPARVFPTFQAREETPEDFAEANERASRGEPTLLRDEGLLPNKGLAQGVLSQQGFLSNAPLRISVVTEEADTLRRAGRLSLARAAALVGARYVLARADEVPELSPEATPVAPVPGGRELLHLEGAPPWAAIHARARFASGIDEALAALRARVPGEVVLESPSPDPALEGPGLEGPGLEGRGQSSLVANARVRLVGAFEPERFELEVESPVRGWLVVRETFARGWRATVRGERAEISPAEIHPADVAFRAVLVPRGSSRVVFEYSAPGAQLGALLSAISALAFLVILFLNHGGTESAEKARNLA